jgi:hypothetical protein
MEPLNLLVSLSHFANPKPGIPPKQPKRRKATPNAPEQREATGARRALHRIRTAVAR